MHGRQCDEEKERVLVNVIDVSLKRWIHVEVNEDDKHSSLSHINTLLKEQFVNFRALCCLLRHVTGQTLSSSDLAGGGAYFRARKV